MRNWDLSKLRNMGFVAHIDAGKTTVSEHVLFYSGETHKLGKVDTGNTKLDYDTFERTRGITIFDAATTCYWRDHQINIIDTPGHVDFTIEVERALRVLDGIVVIFSAVEGVEPQSETVWHQADRYNVPRITFINKLDRIGADPFRVIEQMKKRLAARPLILQLPVGLEENFMGVKDLVRRKVYTWDDDERESQYGWIYSVEDLDIESDEEVYRHYEEMVSVLSEYDEGIMEEFFENGFVDPDRLNRAIRKGTIEQAFVPVLMGAALKHKGIQPLMEAIVDYLPSPLDLPPVRGYNPKTGETEERRPDVNEPLTALVFKVQFDIKSNKELFYLRIYSGELKDKQKVLNPLTGRVERVQKVYRLHANKKEPLQVAYAGDIVGVTGLSSQVTTGHTLTDPEHPIVLEGITVPEPVVTIAVEPKSLKDQDRLMDSLSRVAREDPTIKYRVDEETGQTVVSGMGELHLEILVDRLKRDFRLDVRPSKPQVAYRETISNEAEAAVAVEEELGGMLHKGYVKLRIAPNPRGAGNRIIIPVEIRDVIDEERLGAVEIGIQEVLASGPLMGYPVTDVVAEVLEVGYGTDYTPAGTRIAAYRAARQAFDSAGPILLEPYVEVDVYVPAESVGSIISDLNIRSGELVSIENISESVQRVRFRAPLRKMFGYSNTVQALTQGHVSYQMRVAYFAPVPEEEVKALFLY